MTSSSLFPLAAALWVAAFFFCCRFGNHVCFNISYRFRPLTADWMAKTLLAA
jgi:hypothetical protein